MTPSMHGWLQKQLLDELNRQNRVGNFCEALAVFIEQLEQCLNETIEHFNKNPPASQLDIGVRVEGHFLEAVNGKTKARVFFNVDEEKVFCTYDNAPWAKNWDFQLKCQSSPPQIYSGQKGLQDTVDDVAQRILKPILFPKL